MTSAGVEPIDAVILILLGMITGSSLNFAGADRAGAKVVLGDWGLTFIHICSILSNREGEIE